MLAVVAALVLQAAYSSVEIPLPGRTNYVPRVFFTRSGMMVGWSTLWVSPGHGASTFGQPFLWFQGRRVDLPLDDYKFGHVVRGNDLMLVGDVVTQEGWKAVTWTPDANTGWGAPHLKEISGPWEAAVAGLSTTAAAVSDDASTIYVIARRGEPNANTKLIRIQADLWSEIGRGVSDRVWPTREGLFSNLISQKTRLASRWAGDQATTLPHDGYSRSEIEDVNDAGVAVGQVFDEKHKQHAALWDSHGLRLLEGGSGDYSNAFAVNNLGYAVGFVDERAVVWDASGHIVRDLSKELPDASPRAIGDQEQIAAVTRRAGEQRLYLLTPKVRH